MVRITMAPPIPPAAAKEIEHVKSLVAKHFPVYDVRVSYDVVEFFCRTDPATLEDTFELMRMEMGEHGYIPMITYDKGEHIVTVAKKPQVKYRSITVNAAMLVVTFLTMLVAGTLDWAAYGGVEGDPIFTAENIMMGALTFTLPLMAILGVHELAHFAMARRRKVAASLPFFIPSIPPLGTFGAFISLRDPIPNKKALMEIGVAGPLAGLLMTFPIAILGLVLTNTGAKEVPLNVGSEGVLGISFPLIYQWLEFMVPIEGDFLLHPTAFAAWVGFLVTALNLLPVGQLDGGHVARALLGARAKYLSWVTVAIMVGIGIVYFGWLLFALLILFLGARHPPPLNDISGLDTKRKAVGVLAFALLVVAFVPVPMVEIPADYSFELTTDDGTNATIAQGGSHVFVVAIENTGNAWNDIDLSQGSSPSGWSARFRPHAPGDASYTEDQLVGLNAEENTTVDVMILSAPASEYGLTYTVAIDGVTRNGSETRSMTFNITITSPGLSYTIVNNNLTIPRDSSDNVTITIANADPTSVYLTLDVSVDLPLYVEVVLFNSTIFEPGVSGHLDVSVPGGGSVTFGAQISVDGPATPGEKTVTIDVFYLEVLLTTLAITVQVT